MTPLAALTVPEILASLQTAVFASLGIIAVFGSIWAAFGRAAYRRVDGWFKKLEQRFDAIDQHQAEAQIERETSTRIAHEQGATMMSKLDNLTGKMDNLATTVQDHHSVIYGSGSRAGLIQEVAYLRGGEDQKRREEQKRESV